MPETANTFRPSHPPRRWRRLCRAPELKSESGASDFVHFAVLNAVALVRDIQWTPRRGVASALNYGLDRIQRLRSPFLFLLTCIIALAVLFWYTISTIQCTWSGLEVRIYQGTGIVKPIFSNAIKLIHV